MCFFKTLRTIISYCTTPHIIICCFTMHTSHSDCTLIITLECVSCQDVGYVFWSNVVLKNICGLHLESHICTYMTSSVVSRTSYIHTSTCSQLWFQFTHYVVHYKICLRIGHYMGNELWSGWSYYQICHHVQSWYILWSNV